MGESGQQVHYGKEDPGQHGATRHPANSLHKIITRNACAYRAQHDPEFTELQESRDIKGNPWEGNQHWGDRDMQTLRSQP